MILFIADMGISHDRSSYLARWTLAVWYRDYRHVPDIQIVQSNLYPSGANFLHPDVREYAPHGAHDPPVVGVSCKAATIIIKCSSYGWIRIYALPQ